MKELFFRLSGLILTVTMLLAPFTATVGAAPAERPVPPALDELVPESPPPPRLLEAASSSVRTAGVSPPQPGPELRLVAGAFDPALESASDFLPSRLTLDAYPADVDGYYIVQFDGPVLPEWKAALETIGAQIFDYVPDFGFVVKMAAKTRAVAETLPHVRWVGLYQPGFRLEPSLFDGVLPAEAVPGQLIVVVFPGKDLDGIVEQIEALGGEVLELSQSHWKSKLKLAINPAHAVQIAAINGVRWVEPVPVFELANNEAADIIGVRPVWEDHGLYGGGQIVAVCDTGLDQGSTAPASLHDDFEDGSGNSRVIALYDLVGGGDGAEDRNSGHGTHVAGSVLGNGDLSGAFPVTHTFPSTSYVGMAPDARLVFQAVENDAGSLVGIPLDLADLFTQTYTHGARIHSDSWGGGIYGSYNSRSEDVDEFVWDNPDFLPLFAASNDGIDTNADGVIDLNSVTPPGTAKNCVTVGATENDRPSGSTPAPGYDFAWGTGWPTDYPANPVNSDHVSDDPNGMAAFSSRGPTLDGRYKPDVVAPGTNVASVRSSWASGTGWGAIDANYMFMGGTSMATPLAAGSTALVREWYTRTQELTPTAALMKATLVNGAFDIYPGQYGAGATQEITPTAPNNVEGWGRVDIQASIFPTAPRRFQYVDERTGLGTSSVHTYTFEVVTDSVPLRANLVWSDYPAVAYAAGNLVNDLDLTLYGPGGTITYPTHAVQRGASQHLYYDDWGPEFGRTTGSTVQIAVRFTPTSYPVTVDKGLFYLGSSTTYPQTVNYYIYDDNGSGGNPGTVLASGSTAIRRWDWHVIDLSGHNVTISSGDFYLAIDHISSNPMWTVDTTAPTNNRAMVFFGGNWLNYNSAFGLSDDVMFQAVVRGTDPTTNYDRVNNVVGIHVPTTTLQTGHYTLTVHGYNVPQGPQPYALALNGGLDEMLDVGKVATPDPVEPDALLTYTVRITNTGIAIATHVVLTETYDSNVTYQSATPSPSVGTNVWNLGEIGSGQEKLVTITVRTASGLSAGNTLTNVATVDSVQTDPRAITITTAITTLVTLPRPAWDKQVYVNDVLTDTFPVTVVASDTVKIVDRVWVTYTGNVTFTLVETWTESLDLTGWISDTGEVITTAGTLTWEATGVASNTWHALTKTFHVLTGAWDSDVITESLWVERADPQLGDRVLQFTHLNPDIEVTPALLAATLYPDESVTHTLTISNVGTADLTWSLAENPAVGWLGETPTGDTVASLGHTPVDVTFDSGGLPSGTYTTTLDITSNDPDESLVSVPVTLTVVGTRVTGVDLGIASAGAIYTDTVVIFNADVAPDDATKPYTYNITVDSVPGTTLTSSDDPLVFTDTFATTGTHAVEIAAWNCDMTEVEAVTDVVTFTVREQGVCVDLLEITIHGDTSGTPGIYTFTTGYEPFDASLPISYTWDNGITTATSIRSLGVGTYTLAVTATNCTAALVTDTHVIVVAQPDITVSPPMPADPVNPGETFTRTLTIGNVGDAALIWNLVEVVAADWLSEAPASGTLSPTSSVDVVLTFDSTGLTAGDYTTTLRITSNDPDEPQVDVPVTMTVVCTRVTGVDLDIASAGAIYTDTVVTFNADVAPDDATKPYTYNITVDSVPGTALTSSDDPLVFTDTFATTGTHTVEIAVWNCDMTEGQAMIDTVPFTVHERKGHYVYLPVVLRNY